MKNILVFLWFFAAALHAQEPWMHIVFEQGDEGVQAVDQGPYHFEVMNHGIPLDSENSIYAEGNGPVLELNAREALDFLKEPQCLIEFEICLDKNPSPGNPLQLLTIGNPYSPGTILGIALAEGDQLSVVRYAQGGWKNDAIILSNPLSLYEWSRLGISIQQDKGSYDSALLVIVFLDGVEVGKVVSGTPLGGFGAEDWIRIGGAETPHRSLVGQLRSFKITLDQDVPETSSETPQTSIKEEKITTTPATIRLAAQDADFKWSEELYPYRVEVVLDKAVFGKVGIEMPLDELEEALRRVCPDPVAWDSFAFEKCRFSTKDGKGIEGGFRLVVSDENMVRNGRLVSTPDGALTAWNGSLERVSFETQEVFGENRNVLRVASGPLVNKTISQGVLLESGKYYLLSTLLRNLSEEADISVQMVNPAKKLFLEVHRSYRKLFQLGMDWKKVVTLHRPSFTNGEVRIFTGASGEIADISLRPCHWSLQLEFLEKTDRFYLYYTPRAGHRLSVPGEHLYGDEAFSTVTGVHEFGAEANPMLRSDVRWDGDEGLSLWQVPVDWPLRNGFLETVAPVSPTNAPVKVVLPRGGRETVVLAIRTGTPDATISASLKGIDAKIHRIVPIPVYDGPVKPESEEYKDIPVRVGEWLQDRYDAMTPLGFSLIPPSREGIHLVSLTFEIPETMEAAQHEGSVMITVGLPNDKQQTFDIPVEVAIKHTLVKPMQHFLTSFGGQLISYKSRKRDTDSGERISVAEYHGVKNIQPGDVALHVSVATDPEEVKKQPTILASRYFNRMLDSYISPQIPMLFHAFTYDVKPQGEGVAPVLEHWDFSLYNQAVKQYGVNRDSSWLGIGHTNGRHMDRLTLRDGSVYSFKPPANPHRAWHQVSKEEFARLVGDYYEAIAENLEKMGVLDRAVLIIDESASDTYDDMRDFVLAMRSRPHAKRIRTVHTTHTPALFRIKNENGDLKMEDVIDIPIPQQDEGGAYFQTELHNIWKKPKQIMGYHVQTDHMNLLNAGVTTALIPLKFEHLGLSGWYCWASFVWSIPYPYRGPEFDGGKYTSGPVVNPWVNPFYHHGPGVLSWFYPPDPRGIPDTFTDTIIPSYRLDLLGDGILLRALLEIAEAGEDDAGEMLTVNSEKLQEARQLLSMLWADNPVQWYPNPLIYRKVRHILLNSLP